MTSEIHEVGDFGALIETPGQPMSWMPASFPLPDGGLAVLREPDAVLVVQNGALRVAAVPFTRTHDRVQVLDNAKHMYFSTRTFEAPSGGRLSVEWTMTASISGGRDGDLYDGFVSFHLLNLTGGVAVDVFVANTELATVYARLPFPGAEPPSTDEGPRYFSLFDEVTGRTRAAEPHRYEMIHDRGSRSLEWRMDGDVLKRIDDVDDIGPCHLALGLMTEKDIVPGSGSVSCHGQGAVGTWGDIRVALAPGG
ncbi:MAG: DUF6081 family protein [Thermoanaerobaculia bacterium]|nr:DUF6081 family protein [Thermoanaerobaculia bacterium]